MIVKDIMALLGFKEGETLQSRFFMHFHKNGDNHLFLYQPMGSNALRFCSPSAEWDGNLIDVITFYYNAENSSEFNEGDRIALFLRENNIDLSQLHFDVELSPVQHFNLYRILLQEYGSCKDLTLNNALESDSHLYFFFMDEDVTPGRQHNILGVVSYDKAKQTEQTISFSDLGRSIYFSNPSISTTEAVVFDSFREMIAFKSRMKTDYFYLVFKGEFNTNKAKTISLICGAKSIVQTFLAFPDHLGGYQRDIEYLSVHANVDLKKKTGYLKLSVPQSKDSELFISRLKDLKTSIEKDLDQNSIKNLILIKAGKDLTGVPVFIIEVALIANVLKGLLVLASKHLLSERNFRIIKPKGVHWSEDRANIKNAGKEFKLNIYDTIGKVYQYN
ncbi:hypothetical protein [Flavobacterium sp. ASW18X]|uniref:hypothetical protein n=1 Tax=Flavobacterium sp. ASW18X TaxID=2572595 RepID=UPI0010ADAF52|nr:hypothetical protein [Flavobacterium sp. ASW18X]TKD59002.1 hypothetical protein FBT53_14555 [Flavobacterium sp. ASW18X]